MFIKHRTILTSIIRNSIGIAAATIAAIAAVEDIESIEGIVKLKEADKAIHGNSSVFHSWRAAVIWCNIYI